MYSRMYMDRHARKTGGLFNAFHFARQIILVLLLGFLFFAILLHPYQNGILMAVALFVLETTCLSSCNVMCVSESA